VEFKSKSIVICSLIIAAVSWPAYADFLHAKTPLKNRYLVTLKEMPALDVESVSKTLADQFGGRLLGTMSHAMKGFGINMTDARAHALSKHPFVALVEEDQPLYLANDAPFSFRDVYRQPAEQGVRLLPNAVPAGCPWNGSYYNCTFTDDLLWSLDQLDYQGWIASTDPPGKHYEFASTGAGVRAYILDYGIWGTHVEFDNPSRVEAGANMMIDPDVTDGQQRNDEESPKLADYAPPNNPCNGFNGDQNVGHGTAVASVLGGANTGVAKNVMLVPVKIINCSHQSSMLAMARGLDWIISDVQQHQQRAVVSMSVYFDASAPDPSNPYGYTYGQEYCEQGDHVNYTPCIPAIENEVNNVIGANIPIVVSANNQNTNRCDVQSPARMGYGGSYATTHHTITVGGTMYDAAHGSYVNQRWTCAAAPDVTIDQMGNCTQQIPFGNLIGDPGSNYGACVSIWAPAWNIRVAGSDGPTSYRTQWPAGPHIPSSGTSFSAPYVAGIVARLLERNPTWTPDQVWQALITRANQRYQPVPNFDPSGNNNMLVYISPFE
jgi:subtilisin family serine protease